MTKKLSEKKIRLQNLQAKFQKNLDSGNKHAGSMAKFEACLKFFAEKVDSSDELSDIDAAEIDDFIRSYDNSE